MVAGVAGGLARMLRVDPILIRIAFVVLALFGGSGILLYALGWLLLASDGDQVSPGEALLGRGRSSTSSVVAVGLGVVVVVGLMSTFSWGLPFFPTLVIAVVIGVLMMRHRGRHWTPEQQQSFMDRVDRSVQNISDRASRIGSNWSEHPSDPGDTPRPTSPFDTPAFWERDGHGGWRQAGAGSTGDSRERGPMSDLPTPDEASRVDAPPPPAAPTASDYPVDEHRSTPPAWDPLGVAPFAWDLPEPTPVVTDPVAAPRVRGRGAIGRVTIGTALLAGSIAAVGVFAGWFTMSWAAVSAIALAIVAVGLLIASLRGRSANLIGPGIFLSLVTLALAVTGLSGTSGYGEQTWRPTSVADVQANYEFNAGQGVLDLSALEVKSGQQVTIDVEVSAGHAEVILPAASSGTNYDVTCSANAGRVDCLGEHDEGWRTERSAISTGNTDAGTIVLDVHVGAGYAEVTQHG